MSGLRYLLPILLLLAACEPAEDVRVLPLPPLERISPEARLGLPEVAGIWRFAGWEIMRGDSSALERTFPSFGALEIQVQRLDSIAGTFELGGQPTPVVGEVRRDGWVALVTLNGGAPTAFLTGRVGADTLWLELTSVMPADEWPRGARAAFVQDAPATPIVWLRGTVPGQPQLPPAGSLAADSLVRPAPPAATVPSATSAASATGTPTPGAGGTQGAGTTPPATQGAQQPAPPAPAVRPPAPPAPPPPPPPPPAPEPAPEPVREQVPEPAPETDDGPPLLGVPIQ